MLKILKNIVNNSYDWVNPIDLPDISTKYLEIFEYLVEFEQKFENELIKKIFLRQLISGLILELKYPESFQAQSKELWKWIKDYKRPFNEKDFKSWFHHNHPIMVSLYFMDSIPEIHNNLTKYKR